MTEIDYFHNVVFENKDFFFIFYLMNNVNYLLIYKNINGIILKINVIKNTYF